MSTAAAACHYQSGRFSLAIAEFEQCERLANKTKLMIPSDGERRTDDDDDDDADGEKWITAEDINSASTKIPRKNCIARMEIVALPSLARLADIAMCRFRSAACGKSSVNASSSSTEATTDQATVDDNTTYCLWSDALESNTCYRHALKGAALSLVQTCANEVRLHDQVQQLYQSQPQQQRLDRQCKEYQSIQTTMKSTAMAMLMAGVAASHLYLHNATVSDDTYNPNSADAWSVLVETATLAADLTLARQKFMEHMKDVFRVNDKDKLNTSLDRFNKASSLLEQSICILNEALCDNNSTTIGTANNEREAVTMQSFRTALKVAAMATGRLILPKVDSQVFGERGEQLPKRQKTQDSANDGRRETTTGAWNSVYRHGNMQLQSREQLVDALSFHSALVSSTSNMREAFLQKRELCFNEAIYWESQVDTLFGENIPTAKSEGFSGYAWKIRHCLCGLEVSKSSSKKRQSLRALERLAASISSRFACDLVGCIRAKNGEYSRALEMFQRSLECSEYGDTDEEIDGGLVQRRTLLNMVSCFLALGEVNTPLELMLHLWTTLIEAKTDLIGIRPQAFLLSPGRKEMESVLIGGCNDSTTCPKFRLLWMLFHTTSLARDWATCLSSTEEMMELLACKKGGSDHLREKITSAFALLQCRRPSPAQDICRQFIHRSNRENEESDIFDKLLAIVAELYNADGSLSLERGTNNDDDDSPFQCTRRAESSLSVLASFDYLKVPKLLSELRVFVLNNRGIALLLEGDSVGALSYFREAIETTYNSNETTKHQVAWLQIPVAFNLSLLLLQIGRVEESFKVWLSNRRHLSIWESAMRGDATALSKLRSAHVMAVNRHGLLIAKRGMKLDSMDQENVLEWVPSKAVQEEVTEDSSNVNGVDASQVTALDVVALRYAVSIAEKKSSAMFRRKSGSVGH